MQKITVQCPRCNDPVSVEGEPGQYNVECPCCRHSFDITLKKEQAESPKRTKTCPFCGEDILDSAIKCKHCGEFLDGRIKPSSSLQQSDKPQRVLTSDDNFLTRNRGIGDILIFVPLFAIILILILGSSRSCSLPSFSFLGGTPPPGQR